PCVHLFFFCTDPAPSEIYTLSLHDALPISSAMVQPCSTTLCPMVQSGPIVIGKPMSVCSVQLSWMLERSPSSIHSLSPRSTEPQDRKSTRLNSSHVEISYAVFCLKKKKKKQ